jgi:hypothetical protein
MSIKNHVYCINFLEPFMIAGSMQMIAIIGVLGRTGRLWDHL